MFSSRCEACYFVDQWTARPRKEELYKMWEEIKKPKRLQELTDLVYEYGYLYHGSSRDSYDLDSFQEFYQFQRQLPITGIRTLRVKMDIIDMSAKDWKKYKAKLLRYLETEGNL